MTIELTRQEIMDAPWNGNYEQMILGILQRRGAPIDGLTFLRVNPAYVLTKQQDIARNMIIYTFKEKNKKEI